MGCCCGKLKRMAFAPQIDGIPMDRRLVTELRSIGLVDPSTPCTSKLKYVIAKNPDLFTSVNDFLNYVVIMPSRTLTAPKHGIEKGRAGLGIIRDALFCFEKESDVKKLMELRATGEMLAVLGLNAEELRSVSQHQLVLLEKLSRRKHKLQKSLRRTKKWRKAWNVIYIIFFIGVLAFSVVLVALAAPSAASTAIAVASTSMQSSKPWIDSLWNGRQGILEAEMKVVAAMERGGLLVHGFVNIRSLLEMVSADVGAVLGGIDFLLHRKEEDQEAVAALETSGIANFRNNVGVAEKSIDGLDEEVDRCISEIRKLATEFLKIVTEEIK